MNGNRARRTRSIDRRTASPLLLPCVLMAIAGNVAAFEVRIDLTFLGDLMAHSPTFKMSDYGRIYSGLGDLLLRDDLTFANLETVVDPTKPYGSYPRFNVHPPYVRAAILAGVDVFSLANNHANDYGAASSYRTVAELRALGSSLASAYGRGVFFSGLRSEKGEAMKVTEIRLPDWRIGFISIAEALNGYAGKEAVYLVPSGDEKAREKFLEFVGKESRRYDLFIVGFHGGDEYAAGPSKRLSDFLSKVIAAGAHIVWGHHPHVLQPWTLISGESGTTADRLIMPSMGNLVSAQTWRLGPQDGASKRAATGDSALLRLGVRRSLLTGEISLDAPEPIWISTRVAGGETRIRLLEELLIDLSGPWLDYYRERKASLAAFGAACVPPVKAASRIFADPVNPAAERAELFFRTPGLRNGNGKTGFPFGPVRRHHRR